MDKAIIIRQGGGAFAAAVELVFPGQQSLYVRESLDDLAEAVGVYRIGETVTASEPEA